MSKSLGNFHTLRDLLNKGYTGREVRYPARFGAVSAVAEFHVCALDAARAALGRSTNPRDGCGARGGAGCGRRRVAFAGLGRAGSAPRFKQAMDDDLNVSEALAAIFDMMHEANRAMDAGDGGWSASSTLELMNGSTACWACWAAEVTPP